MKMHRLSIRTIFPVVGIGLLSAATCPAAPAGKEPPTSPQGIVVDDDAAAYTGHWVRSTKQPAVYGPAYHHDNQAKDGGSAAVFTPKLAEAGEYEVRLCYVPTDNRSTRTRVTVQTADGPKEVTINQRQPLLDKNGVPRALGTFRLAPDGKTAVTISNAGADGFVVVDAVQFLPVALAVQERSGSIPSGWPANLGAAAAVRPAQSESAPNPAATAAALSPMARVTAPTHQPIPADTEPVHLAKASSASDVANKNYDVVIVGATGSGVLCAVRAAREGCRVLLVQHNEHIGGMMTNGLMQWDALYGGPRAPLFTELLRNIEKHYIQRFGRDSKEHQTARYTHEHYPISWAEPRVAEREFNRLVAAEKNITLLLSHYPVSAEREEALIKEISLSRYGTSEQIKVTGTTFVDATYEGDLFALAKVPFRVGREARDEYNEPFAGKTFVNIDHEGPASIAGEGLNLRAYGSRQGTLDPTSPFTADGAVQAYNYRFCVTKDPANRVLPDSPPPGYDRNEYVKYDRKSISTNAGPNLKSHMNSPILPGENHRYPEAGWPEREKIIDRHKNFALGLMWFLQNDESISEKARVQFREWGLPRDEFQDNQHIPYEMYVREARRIVGRHVFTSHDNSAISPGLRTPIHPDSVAVTDWYMDSHSCTKDSRPGFRYDGKLILTEESRPAQIPYRSLLPQGVDNLLVPVCLGATHVAWGAIRLEPVWMQTGEAAGLAAAQATQTRQPAASIDSAKLVRTLVQRGQLVSFFNDIKADADNAEAVAAQYFATQGFLPGYQARLKDPLDPQTGAAWAQAFERLKTGTLNPQQLATSIASIEKQNLTAVSSEKSGKPRGAVLLEMWRSLAVNRAPTAP
jgi:hypothetical protein